LDGGAGGRTRAQQATPVIVCARDPGDVGAGDVYNGTCPNNGVSVQLKTLAGAYTDGWVHVLIP
jgi:hypothetical protein